MTKKALFIILILLVEISIVSINLAGTILTKNNLEKSLIQKYSEDVGVVSTQVSKVLETRIGDLQNYLNIMATNVLVKDGNTEECNAKLEEIKNSGNLGINNIGRVDKDGFFRCSLNPGIIGTDAHNLGSYISEIFEDPEHKPVMSRLILIPNLNIYAVALHVPVFNDAGEFDGTLGGAIYLQDIQNEYLKDVKVSENGYVVMLDNNGDILYHPEEELMAQNYQSEIAQNISGGSDSMNEMLAKAVAGETGTMQYTYKGDEKIAAYTKIPIAGDRYWTVLANVPLEDARTILNDINLNNTFIILNAILIASTVLLLLFILLYTLRTIIRPVNTIRKAAQDIGNGDFKTRLNFKPGKDEISDLAKSIDEMAAKLESSYSNLEAEVQKKTAELGAANDKLSVQVSQEKQNATEAVNYAAQLEQTNRVMVDRENKMVELKAEIEELKKRLGEKEATPVATAEPVTPAPVQPAG